MIQKYFEEITDRRQQGKIKYNLLEIVVMTICAVIAGCEAWEDIHDYCRVKETWFREALGMKLENGIPSHDTIQRIWSMIDPKEFERCFCGPGRKFCVKTDKHQSREREENKGSPKLGTAQLDQASPSEFRDGRRYARAA